MQSRYNFCCIEIQWFRLRTIESFFKCCENVHVFVLYRSRIIIYFAVIWMNLNLHEFVVAHIEKWSVLMSSKVSGNARRTFRCFSRIIMNWIIIIIIFFIIIRRIISVHRRFSSYIRTCFFLAWICRCVIWWWYVGLRISVSIFCP